MTVRVPTLRVDDSEQDRVAALNEFMRDVREELERLETAEQVSALRLPQRAAPLAEQEGSVGLYTLDDGHGNVELYAVDESGNHRKLTPGFNAVEGTVTTTGTTQTPVVRLPLEPYSVYFVDAAFVGRDAAGTERHVSRKGAMFYRGSGGAAQSGSNDTFILEETDGALGTTFSADGNDITGDVIGLGSTTIHWRAILTYMKVS